MGPSERRGGRGEPLERRQREVVAVFNNSADLVELLRTALEQAGFTVVTGFTSDIRSGDLDFRAFFATHRPRVVVFDVGPPYDANWALFRQLRNDPAARGTRFILTSTDAAYVQKIAAGDERVYEIARKPFDLDRITRAAKEAVRARDTR